MGKFSSQEVESQYNLIKMLLAEPEKYKDAIDAIKKDIAYMPIELKKKLEEENINFLMKRLATPWKRNLKNILNVLKPRKDISSI